MSAVITQPPKLVATAAMDRSNQNTNFVGATALVRIGSNLYAAVAGNSAPSFQVFKSTDQGTTWTRMNQAGEPVLVAFPLYEVVAAQDGLYFVWDDDHSHESMHYARFDPATDTWGPNVETPHNITTNSNMLCIARRSNGDILVFYQAATLSGTIHWGTFSHAGVWTGENVFNATSQLLVPIMAVAGPDDTIHVLIQDLSGPYNFYYQNLSPGNVVSAPQLIQAGALFAAQAGLGTVWNNQIIFPYTNLTDGNPAMFVGTPTASPIWSNIALTLVTPLADVAYPIAFVSGSTLLVFVTLQNSPTFQLWYSTFPASALLAPLGPTLYYDAVADPPAAGPVDEILKVSIIPGLSGMVGMQLTPGFPPENAYFLSGAKRCLQ